MVPITNDTLSLLIVLLLFLAFIVSYLSSAKKDRSVKEELVLEPEPIIEPDEVLSVVEKDVTDDQQAAAVEGIAVGQTIEVATKQIDMMFHGIDMAQLPDVEEAKQIRWLREQMAALHPEGKKRSVPFAVAGKRLTDWHLELGRQAAQAMQQAVAPVAVDKSIAIDES